MDGELEALFRSEYPRLVAVLTVGSGMVVDDVADAVQDAFLQAHRHWKRVRVYEDPAGWVRRVALNRLVDRRRRLARSGVVRPHLLAATAVADPEPTDIMTAIDRLPEGQRIAVLLRYFDDLSTRDVSRLMGVSEGTVKSQLHEARKRLAREPEVLDER